MMDATPEGGGQDVVNRDGMDATPPPDTPAPEAGPDATPPPDTAPDGDAGHGPLTASLFAQCRMDCANPLDAVPSSDGSIVYFTAFTSTGEGALFRVTSGGTPQMIVGGFEYPLAVAISNDDMTVYVGDRTATRSGGAGTVAEAAGAVYAVSVSSMSRMELNIGMTILQIAALNVSPDGLRLYISARAMTGEPGVFIVGIGGGTAMPVAMGGAFSDPSGISVAPDGALLVHDLTAGGATSAAVVRVASGTSTTMLGMPRLVANYPAGLALTMDGAQGLLAGSPGAPGDGLLTLVDTASMSTSTATDLSAGMVSPNGIHRARMANIFAVADDTAMGTGAIFVVR